MFRSPLPVDLIVGTNVKKNDRILKFYIDNSYVSCDRERPFASKFAGQGMIIQRITKLSRHEQGQSFCKLIYELNMRLIRSLKCFSNVRSRLIGFIATGLS